MTYCGVARSLIVAQQPTFRHNDIELHILVNSKLKRSFKLPSLPSFTMTRINLLKLARLPIRNARSAVTQHCFRTAPRSVNAFELPSSFMIRQFSATATALKGISPESADPRPKEPEDVAQIVNPTEITDVQYHELSDKYMDNIISKLEELQEEREDVDVEFSVSLLPDLLLLFLSIPTNSILHYLCN